MGPCVANHFLPNLLKTPLHSHADTLISLLGACGNAPRPPATRLLPARSWALLPAPPVCVLASVARFCRASPTLCPNPFFFLPLHFLVTLLYILLTGTPAKPFFVVLFSMVRRKTLRILSLLTISHLNKLASWPAPCLLHAVIAASPGSLLYLCSYFIHFPICRQRRTWACPLPPGRSPLSTRDLGFPERCTVNEMWHCHMYLDKIYQWMN